jgi:hypothetical protein
MKTLVTAIADSPMLGRVAAVFGVLGLALVVTVLTWQLNGLLAVALIGALLVGTAVLLWPVTGVLILFATILFKYPEAIGRLPIGPNRILGGVLALMLIAAVAAKQPMNFMKTAPYRAYLFVFFMVMLNFFLVGGSDAPVNLAALDLTGRTMDRTITQLAFLTFFGAFVRKPKHILLIIGLFLLAMFITVPGAITHTYDVVGGAVPTGMEKGRAVAVGGIQSAENANRLAFLANVAIAIIWFAALHYRSLLLYLASAPAILALVLTVFLSGSRSGLINLVFLMILLAVQSGIRASRMLTIGLLVLGACAIGYFVVPDQIRDRITSFVPSEDARSATISTNLRLLMLSEGMKFTRQNPFFGVGIGNIRWTTAMDPATGGQGLTMHDAYMLSLVEGGILLLGSYLVLFAVTLLAINRAVKRSELMPEIGLGWLTKSIRTSLLMLLVFSAFADAWGEFYFAMIIGSAMVLSAFYMQPRASAAAAPVLSGTARMPVSATRWPLSPSST